MKVIYKIIIILISLFLLGLLITKISIDHTFKKAEKEQISSLKISIDILKNTKQV